MSAAESITEADIRTAFVQTCALAREYKYVPPIEDCCNRRGYLLVEDVQSTSSVAAVQSTPFRRVTSEITETVVPLNWDAMARAARAENSVRVERVLPAVHVVPRIRPDLVVASGGPLRRRRTKQQIEALVADYLKLCELPFARGQLKALASRHGFSNGTSLAHLLKYHGVWRNRRDNRSL